MTRDEFMNAVYDELHSDGSNCRANNIIDLADEYVKETVISVLQGIRNEMMQYREICIDGTPVLASKLDIAAEIIDKKVKEYN